MGKNVYLYEGNAEELLPDVINFMKNKVAQESRIEAFDDCTQYWKERMEIILNENSPSVAKLSQIRQSFGIKYHEGE